MRSGAAVFALMAVLAGCATPQQQCISASTREYRSVNAAIVETKANIERGYAVYRQRLRVNDWGNCHRDFDDPFDFFDCPGTDYVTLGTPVQISVPEEKAKLGRLERRLRELQTPASAAVAQCKLLHPQ